MGNIWEIRSVNMFTLMVAYSSGFDKWWNTCDIMGYVHWIIANPMDLTINLWDFGYESGVKPVWDLAREKINGYLCIYGI